MKAETILEAVCKASEIPLSLVVSKSRRLEFVSVRRVFAHMAKLEYGFTLMEIANTVNRTDHTTIINLTSQDLTHSEVMMYVRASKYLERFNRPKHHPVAI